MTSTAVNGPTAGDLIELADTGLVIRVEADAQQAGDTFAGREQRAPADADMTQVEDRTGPFGRRAHGRVAECLGGGRRPVRGRHRGVHS